MPGWQVPGAASISIPGIRCQPAMAVAVDSVFDRLLDRFLPPRCVLCGRSGQFPALDLCPACDNCLPLTPGNALLCSAAPPDRVFAPYVYAPPIDAMIQALKYRGHLTLGRVLGELLARGAAELGLPLDVDCVMPVPLHPHRHASRGFNQSAEIARFAARRLRLPVAAGIAIRQMATPPQVGLPAADRRANLVHAFAASAPKSAWPAHRHRRRRRHDREHRRRAGADAAQRRGGVGGRVVRGTYVSRRGAPGCPGMHIRR